MFKNSDLIIPRDKKGTRHEVGIGNQYSDLPGEGHKDLQGGPCGHHPQRDKCLTGAQVRGNDYRGTSLILSVSQWWSPSWPWKAKPHWKPKKARVGCWWSEAALSHVHCPRGAVLDGFDGDSGFPPSFCSGCSHYRLELAGWLWWWLVGCQCLESSTPTVSLSIGVGWRKSHSVFIIKGLAMA